MNIQNVLSRQAALLAMVFVLAVVAKTNAQAPNTQPATTAPATTAPAAPASTQADTAQVKQDREWLVAYLIAHQGYRVDQMDMLEKRIDAMSPTQVETLVDVYRQKHDLALQREANYQRFQQQQFSMIQAQQAQQAQQQDNYTKELDASANLEQNRLDTQAQQAETPQNFPSGYAPYGYGYGYPAYGSYYDRYWH